MCPMQDNSGCSDTSDVIEQRELSAALEKQGRELLRLAADKVAADAAQRESKLQRRMQQRAASPSAPKFHPATGRPVGSWELVPGAVSATDIVELSATYESAAATLEPEMSRYGGVEWTATRTYCDEGKPPSPGTARLLGPVFEPLIAAVQLQLEGCCACPLKLESAFATLYSTDSNTGMADHRDFDSGGRLVACSAILQGYSPDGFEGGGLLMRTDPGGGTNGCDGPEQSGMRKLVELEPGDLVLLFGAWHEPREILGGQRLVFVFFFHEAVVRMAMDGGAALEEARSEMATRREKFATPPVMGSPEPEREAELKSARTPQVALLEPDVAASDSRSSSEVGAATTAPPVVLGASFQSHNDLYGSKAEALRAAAKGRLAERLAQRQKAAVEREEIATASGWLDREPAKLPRLMQAAWEWARANAAVSERSAVSAISLEPKTEPDLGGLDTETATGLALLAYHGLRIVRPPEVAAVGPAAARTHAAAQSSANDGKIAAPHITHDRTDDWRTWCLIPKPAIFSMLHQGLSCVAQIAARGQRDD